MQPPKTYQRIPGPGIVSDLLATVQTDPELAPWRDEELKDGGIVWLRCEDMTAGCTVCHKDSWAVLGDRTIGQMLTTVAGSAKPILSVDVPEGHQLVVAPHTFKPDPVYYVCPGTCEEKHVRRETPGFCPETGSALVVEAL